MPPEARAAVDITEVRVESVTATSFGVRVNSLGSGWSYRLYASTDKADVYVANLGEGPYRSSLARVPRLSLTGLRYTTKPIWYRVRAAKGTARRTSEIFSIGLKPAMPSGLSVAGVKGAVSLSWGGGPASGAQVQQATDAGFTTGLRTYTLDPVYAEPGVGIRAWSQVLQLTDGKSAASSRPTTTRSSPT